jgi:hypothetical protein
MSLEHAKAMVMIMRRNLKRWEGENQPIYLPTEAYRRLGLEASDW